MTQRASAVDALRAKRTDKLLLEALLELTVQKGFSAVSVSDITKYAGVNRATFYRHYEDKFDLLNRYTQAVYEILDTLPDPSPQKLEDGTVQHIAPGLVTIFEHIHANARFYRVMLGQNGDPMFAGKIRQYIKTRIWRSLPPELQKDDSAVDLYLSYSSSASVGAVLWWLEHDMPYSAEEMATISYQLGVHLSAMLGQTQLDGATQPEQAQMMR